MHICLRYDATVHEPAEKLIFFPLPRYFYNEHGSRNRNALNKNDAVQVVQVNFNAQELLYANEIIYALLD